MAKTARKPKAARLKKKPAGAPSWPADKIERRPIGELLSYPQNPMRHSEEQVAVIAESMREFGWTMPVLVDEKGVLICGHGRIAAAQKLGLAVPVMTATGWTEAQKKAYRIAGERGRTLPYRDLLRIAAQPSRTATNSMSETALSTVPARRSGVGASAIVIQAPVRRFLICSSGIAGLHLPRARGARASDAHHTAHRLTIP